MTTIATLEARYTANIIAFDAQLRRMQQNNARAGQRIAQQNQSTINSVNRQWQNANIGGAINRSLGSGLGSLKAQLLSSIAAITSGAGIAAAVGLADTYNRFTNSLKVAGVEGANLAVVQERLFNSAVRNGVAVESLGQLYGRVAQSAGELGVSQNDILKVTDAVSAAIRVSGGTVESASGAMLQMAQALGSGTVRAEEFNSMVEGMLPLVQAAAGASTKYGGSVAKMRADVLAGKLASKEFFDLIVAGSAALEAKAAKAPLTVAQSFESLKTKLVEYMGATNETWGITDRLTEALTFLANNIDGVANVLGVIAIALSAALAPALGRAAIGMATLTASTIANAGATLAAIPGQIGFAAALTGTSRAAVIAGTALRMLATSTGVGLALVAITAAVGFFAAKAYRAAEATRQLRDRVREKAAALDEAQAAADTARQQTGNLTAAELQAATAAAALTGEQGKLESAYYRVAAAAKAAELAQLRVRLAESTTDLRTETQNYRETYARERDRASRPGMTRSGRMDGGYNVSISPQEVEAQARARANASETGQSFSNARRVLDADRQALREAENRRLDSFAPTRTSSGGGGTGGSRSGGSRSKPDDRSDEAIAQAERELRDAIRAQADTAAERAAVALEALADDRTMADLAIEKQFADGEITAAARDRLKEINAEMTAAKVATEAARRTEELREAERELTQLRNDNAVEAARLDAEELDDMARNAATMSERHSYERQALDAQQRADRLMFDAQQAALRLQLEKNGQVQAEIDRIIADREATFTRGQNGDRTAQGRSQTRENGPSTIDEWLQSFTNATSAGKTFNQQLFDIAEGGINSITDGLTDAIMGAKSLGEAFGDMAKAMIAQLIKLAVQFVVFETLGRAFGVPGLGKAAIGLAAPSGAKVGSNAMGTRFWGGGPTSINEKGDEVITLPTGSQVIPANVVQRAVSVAGRNRSAGQTIVNNVVIDAKDAVLTQQVKEWVHEGMVKAVNASRMVVREDSNRGAMSRLGR